MKKATCVANTCGQEAHNLLSGTGDGQVHSVFSGAVNLILDGQLIFCLPGKKHPWGLTMEQTDFRLWEIKPGDYAQFRFGDICIPGKIKLSTGSSLIWKQPMQVEIEITPLMLKERVSFLKKKVLTSTELQEIFPSRATRIEFLQKISELEMAEEAELLLVAKQFVGLGPGLTPLGDDLLSGFFFCVQMITNSCEYKSTSSVVNTWNFTKTLPWEKTNYLAREQVKMAAQGWVLDSVYAFLAEMVKKENMDPSLMEEIENIGASSGIGWLLGIYMGTEYFLSC